MKDQDFIKSLAKNHSKVASLPNANRRAFLFGVLSFIGVLFLINLGGGLRSISEDYGFNLQTLELLSTLIAFFSLLIISFNSSIPGNSIHLPIKVFYICSLVFLTSLGIRYFFIPNNYAPMLNRVFHCSKEVLFYAGAIQLFLYWRISKGVLINLKSTVIFTTLAAAILPMMLMAIGCCITPKHIWTSHFIPLASYTLIVACAQYYFLRKNYEY